jgi:hypothetical protein
MIKKIVFQQLDQLNLGDLKRDDLGAALNFSSVYDRITLLKSEYILLNKLNINTGDYLERKIEECISSFLLVCSDIKSFNYKSESESLASASGRRSELIIDLEKVEEKYLKYIKPYLTEGQVKNNLFQEEIKLKLNNLENKIISTSQESNDSFKQKINEINGHLDRMKHLEGDAQNLILKVKNELGNKATGKYLEVFSRQANINKWLAVASLFLFIISIFFFFALSDTFFKEFVENFRSQDFRSAYIISFTFFKLILLSAYFLFVKESLKSFNVNMHLYNLNKHRENALETFNSFIETPGSEKTRDYVIEEIVGTIYSQGKTGYLSEDKKSIDTNQLLEIIKSVANIKNS